MFISKLWNKAIDSAKSANYKRSLKVALVLAPLVVWEVFFFVMQKLMAVSVFVDDKIAQFLRDFVENN
jgi:hypothetical protein